MKRIAVIIIICIFSVLLLCGCSAESPLPVSAAAISRTKEGYKMTAELIRQDSLDGDAEPVYLTAEGESLPALFDDAVCKLGGHFYFSHAETVIVDITLARQGLTELAAFLAERPDARLTLRLVVARGAPAEEILQLEALGESIPGVALYDLLEGLTARGEIPDLPLYQVHNALQNAQAVQLPCLYETEDGHAASKGLAVLENGVLSGFLPEEAQNG